MSKSIERINRVVDKLRNAFENTPYYLRVKDGEGDSVPKDDLLLSVIIPARQEFPNIVHTFHAIMNCIEADGIDPKEVEIIIVNNTSEPWNDPKFDWTKPGDRGTVEYLMPRGGYWSRTLRVLYDPIAGNHSARNKGAKMARGKYLFFSDAHMSYKPGFFKLMLETIEKTKGMFHGSIAWMGAYPPHDSAVGTQYTIKLGEEIKGTWANYRPWNDKFFYIFGLGHCSVGVERKQFLEFGGYPDVHRTYGGGEFFVDALWWMMGSNVSTHPNAIGYHLASSRGYSYNHDDYIENVLGIASALGMDDWRERTYINYLRRGRKEVMDKIMERSEREHTPRREKVLSEVKKSFNDLLIERPWDKLNMEVGGAKNSSLLIFHNTWLALLKKDGGVALEAYKNSKYQKDLEKFILENLKSNVYKYEEYKDVTI